MNTLIRSAKIKDVVSICALIGEATNRGKVLKRSAADVRKAIGCFWVIEHDGHLIACGALEIYNKKLAEVRSLSVHHGYEKKGLATQLLQQLLQEAKKKKIYEVLAITDKENLFKRQGFSEQLQGQKPLFLRP